MKNWFKKDNLEYEFLPPALEIERTPPSPLGRAIIWIIFSITTVTILWACLGKVDEVAVARGKIIPEGDVKIIQAFEEGIIKAIHVEEGQRVKRGDLLVELDSTIKQADVESIRTNLNNYIIEKKMLEAELKGIPVEDIIWPDEFKKNSSIQAVIRLQADLKNAREAEFRAQEESLKLVVSQKEHELKAAQTLVPLYEQDFILIKTETDAYRTLMDSGGYARMDFLKKEIELNEAAQKLEQQKIAVIMAEDILSQARINLEIARSKHQILLFSDLQEKEKAIAALQSEVVKANRLLEAERMVSPVNGTVHGLNSHTIGGVVTTAQPIVTIVPDGTTLIAEASVLNKDIGFIHEGQRVEVKLDTFLFQKYGTINGRVISVSPDAFDDEKQGPVYKIKVSLDKDYLIVNNRKASVSPGMTVSVEVKTGQRRIIEFFLSPIMKYVNESFTLR